MGLQMWRQQRIAIALGFVLGGICGMAVAQETAPPEADAAATPAGDAPTTESTYFDLRRSKDRLTQQLAERYFNLVKMQEWSSDKGTKIKAKYVAHSPDLKSVTLSMAKSSGGERVDREVPVARLSKTSQSRVKQIDIIQKKLDERIAAGAEGESDSAGADPADDPGAPMLDERGAEPAPRRPPTPPRRAVRPGREEQPVQPPAAPANPPPAAPPAEEDGGADPLGFGELPENPVPAGPPSIGVPFAATASPPGAAAPNRIKPNDKSAWRTDYEAFRKILTSNASREAPQADLAAIKELKAAADTLKKWEATGSVGDEARREIDKKFEAVGEFAWEATLTDADVSSGNWTERLNLPPLPAPLSIGFMLDPEREQGNWQRFQAGDRVRFVGRFIDVENENDIVAAIRFPDDAAATPVE
jgi:hypothetical protein